MATAMRASSRPLRQLGQRQLLLNRNLIQALQEGLGAIRDVLLDGSQAYASIYRQANFPFHRVGLMPASQALTRGWF